MTKARWLVALALAGCVDAGHLGNPVLLPVQGAATVLSNASYDARRDRVSAYLVAHRVAVLAQDPEALAELWQLADVPAHDRPAVLNDLAALPAGDWVEQATIAVMVRSR